MSRPPRGRHWRRAAALAAALCSLSVRAIDLRVREGDTGLHAAPDPDEKPLLPLFSKEYSLVHRDWFRGGAWRFHDSYHPCARFGQSCDVLGREKGRVHLRANATIVAHMAAVEVAFEFTHAADEASVEDTIAVFCVDDEVPTAKEIAHGDAEPDEVVRDLNFFDYVYVGEVATTKTADGRVRGSLVTGPLVNQRCSYQFRYLKYVEPLVYQNVGESAHIEMERGHTEPLQVHLALTNRSTEMRVHWVSGKVVEPQVLYSTKPDGKSSSQAFATRSETYDSTDMCGDHAHKREAAWFRAPGFMHDAVLTDLVPGQEYFVRVGSANGVWSEEFSFRQPPGAGMAAPKALASLPQSFFVFGDLGEIILEPETEPKPYQSFIDGVSRPSVSGNALQLMIEDYDEHHGTTANYLGVLHVGDLSYARGRTFQWDQFGARIQPLASRIPYMVAIGNHEYDYTDGGDRDVSGAGATNGWHPEGGNFGTDSGGECGLPTAKRFRMPENGNGVFWYSFETGLTHHAVISSEHDATRGAPMHEWLVRDLARVDRATTPWLVVHLHRAMYCSQAFEEDYDVSVLLRDALEDVLLEHRVDLVFSGHYHAYERTCAVRKGECVDDDDRGFTQAPVHVMIGSAGALLDDAQYWDKRWSANVQNEYGYGRLLVYNHSHAHVEFARVKGKAVADDKWIVSDHAWAV